jgi:C-terminal processing protease CtpA/Prc
MEHLNVENFAKEVLEFIENNKPEKLIIDMRNNFGGNSMLLDNFIDKLSTITNINSPERLFVVVGRETFSSALLNVYSLKEKTAAKFIGEASGGKPNCYGEVERFSLKNSKLTISYSTEYYQVVEDDSLESFVPDVLIEPSIKDFVNGTDPVLDYIRPLG